MYGVTLVCFASSYAAALGLELWRQFRPRQVWYLLALGFGVAGLLAQSIYLAIRPVGWMILLAWVLAVFYLYGSIHYRKLAWGVFVLPLVLGLLGISAFFGTDGDRLALTGAGLLNLIHGLLLLLAAVGVCVGFLASVMYLFQRTACAKVPPRQGLRLLSLERLELMNRRAVDLAFPLLTAGSIVGVFLMIQQPPPSWTDHHALAAAVLWVTFLVLLVLRYGWNLRGRAVAYLTIAAFALLVVCIVLLYQPWGGPR